MIFGNRPTNERDDLIDAARLRLPVEADALSLFATGLVGCAEKSSTTTTTKKTTPGGTTTTTTEKEVKKTGDNPPSEGQ